MFYGPVVKDVFPQNITSPSAAIWVFQTRAFRGKAEGLGHHFLQLDIIWILEVMRNGGKWWETIGKSIQSDGKTTVRQSKVMESYGKPSKIDGLSMVIIIFTIKLAK